MTKSIQFVKNIDLSEKLANYLAEHASLFKEKDENTSYVVFSSNDKELNKSNKKVLESLLDEGRHVIKAEETNDKKNPWIFTPISAA